MFDVGFSELILLAVIALVVLGPEKLPHAARMAGAWLGRIRRAMTSIQIEIEKEVAASEFRERMNQEMERLKAATNPIEQEFNAVEQHIRQNLDPTAESASHHTAAHTTTADHTSATDTAEALTTSTLELPAPLPTDAASAAPTTPVNLIKSPPL